MSAAAVYIGDEASAAGYRLAGLDTIVPDAGTETVVLHRAIASASLVLVSSAVAARIAVDVLDGAQAALAPLLLIVPDIAHEHPMPDVAARLRAQLGFQA
ncbi:MAG TPA: V-type ATP synthase subunit F [Casimicrobiaceae bacterium]|nr:V-type ATP synthase subunit F [Casimicrobiaceae bacterium]